MTDRDPFADAGGDDENPLADFLRQFGIQPGADGSFDVNQLMARLQGVMAQFTAGMQAAGAGDGTAGLNWDFVKDIARKVTAASGPDPAPGSSDQGSVRDTVALADLWLDQHTAFGRIAATPAAWSRAEWVEHTFATWRQLTDPVSTSLAGAIADLLRQQAGDIGMAPMLEPMMRLAATGMLSSQIGQALGQLSTGVVSVSDLGFPLTQRPVVALLETNIARFADGLEQSVDDVRFYVALREAARQRLFAHVPWLGPQLLALVEHYARDIRVDAAAIEEAMESHLAGGLTPDSLERLGNTVAGKLFQPALTGEQKEVLERLETLVALVEGWVDDVVAQTTAQLMPQAAALAETVRRRRATAGPAETALKSLLNLELRPRRVRDAANLWAAVRTARGSEERDAVWAHPDLIPTGADLDDPLGFSGRGRTPTAPDDLDAQLAQLLDEEHRRGTEDTDR